MKKSVFAVILSVFLISCSTMSSSVGSFEEAERIITTSTWLLQDENGTVVSYNGQEVSLSFYKADGIKAFGFGGCNQYSTNVNLTPEKMEFGEILSTMMACPEMEVEEAFTDLLTLVDNYEINGRELKLYQGKILLMNFIRK